MRKGHSDRATWLALIISTSLARTATGGGGVVADLAITKTDGLASYVPGQTLTYTIVVTNNDTSDSLIGASVTDTVAADLTGASWTCAPTLGSACGSPSGTGNIGVNVDLAPLGSATFTLTATASPTAASSIANTATVTPPAGVTDPTPGNNSATDTDARTPVADLSITKTDGHASYVPGQGLTYTIVVTNQGSTDAANGAAVVDTIPLELTGASWTCVASVGSACGGASGNGNIGTTVDLLPLGTATFTVTATASPSASASITNTATVGAPAGVADPTPGNNSASDTDTRNPVADLSVTKTDGQASYVPGLGLTYTIVVTNQGTTDAANGATVVDTIPAALTGASWTCVASAGSACTAANGTGNIGTTVDLLPLGTATFTVTATASPSAATSITNTATVSAPAGVADPTPGNNSASDTDTRTPVADLSITKSDGQDSYVAGSSLTYTIVVTNQGTTDAANGATVVDTIPPELTGVSWACLASAGSACGTASGTADIGATVDLLPGGTATFTLSATVGATTIGSIVNTASVTVPAGVSDPTRADNTATDTDTMATMGFHTVAPCRLLDTRHAPGPLGGPALVGGATRTFHVAGSCGIPDGAKAFFANLTVVSPTADGHLRVDPSGTSSPNVSTLNYAAGQTRANNGIFALDASGRIDIACVQVSGSAGVIIDVAGYFTE